MFDAASKKKIFERAASLGDKIIAIQTALLKTMTDHTQLKEKISGFPKKPGVYLMKDFDGDIII